MACGPCAGDLVASRPNCPSLFFTDTREYSEALKGIVDQFNRASKTKAIVVPEKDPQGQIWRLVMWSDDLQWAKVTYTPSNGHPRHSYFHPVVMDGKHYSIELSEWNVKLYGGDRALIVSANLYWSQSLGCTEKLSVRNNAVASVVPLVDRALSTLVGRPVTMTASAK